MIYEYNCECGKNFDVIKSHVDMEREEACECGKIAKRMFVPRKVGFIGASVTHAEYNPGLGKVIRNKQHLDYECKSKNVIPVGNDYGSGEKMIKETEKAKDEARKKAWESVDV